MFRKLATPLTARGVLSLMLSAALVLPAGAMQAPPAQAGVSAVPAPKGIRIIVLDGQNAVNSLILKTAVNPVVQVLNALEDPVEGAEVTFEVLPSGPGGTFSNGRNAITTRTDLRGQASAAFVPNGTAGQFTIKVTAKWEDQTAEARIRQTNDANSVTTGMAVESRPWYKSWKWWAIIGAAAGGGAAAGFLLRGSDPTVNISPGTVVVGGPR